MSAYSTPVAPLPRSTIYISSDVAQQPASTPKHRFKTDISKFHFFLILKAGSHYTLDILKECGGQYECHNCRRKIMKQMYFYPEIFLAQIDEPICNIIPHCRTSCIYRTLQDMPNNCDLLINFFLMDGHDIVCAPPRFLLVIPGGYTIEEYHQVIDKGQVIQQEEPLIQSFFAPIYISSTMQSGHQLLDDIVTYIDEMRIQKKSSLGPSRTRDDADHHVVALQTKALTDTPLAQVFNTEPSSFDRPGVKENPHMK